MVSKDEIHHSPTEVAVVGSLLLLLISAFDSIWFIKFQVFVWTEVQLILC